MFEKPIRLVYVRILLILLIKSPLGILSILSRRLNENNPQSWEFSVFSAGGEDGILNYLLTNIKRPNKYFVEFGSSNGVSNNTAFFALAGKYSGLMVEGNPRASKASKFLYKFLNKSVNCVNYFISLDNINQLLNLFKHVNPDLLSIDIDGIDYYILEAILKRGILPKVIIVEYNATFGPKELITIPYSDNFCYSSAHPSRLYYGVSFSAWNSLLKSYNYTHVTVDSAGVNSIYALNDSLNCDISALPSSYIFKDNIFEEEEHKGPHDTRFELISSLPFNRLKG